MCIRDRSWAAPSHAAAAGGPCRACEQQQPADGRGGGAAHGDRPCAVPDDGDTTAAGEWELPEALEDVDEHSPLTSARPSAEDVGGPVAGGRPGAAAAGARNLPPEAQPQGEYDGRFADI
eukprot:3889811-Prymnesium_polylepis.2